MGEAFGNAGRIQVEDAALGCSLTARAVSRAEAARSVRKGVANETCTTVRVNRASIALARGPARVGREIASVGNASALESTRTLDTGAQSGVRSQVANRSQTRTPGARRACPALAQGRVADGCCVGARRTGRPRIGARASSCRARSSARTIAAESAATARWTVTADAGARTSHGARRSSSGPARPRNAGAARSIARRRLVVIRGVRPTRSAGDSEHREHRAQRNESQPVGLVGCTHFVPIAPRG